MAVLSLRALTWMVWAAAVLGPVTNVELAAQQSCDPAVIPASGDDGYRLRSDGPARCEGVYRRSVGFGIAAYLHLPRWFWISYANRTIPKPAIHPASWHSDKTTVY